MFQMNTIVAIVGPYCSGKSIFRDFLQRKFTGKSPAELIFPETSKAVQKRLIKARNAALDDTSLTFDFLAQAIQSSAKTALSAFRGLESRQFLFLENSPEFWDVIVTAARNTNLITQDQWCLLRTLMDELAATFVVDIFILVAFEDQEACGNFHRQTGRSEHRQGAPLQRWNTAIDALMPAWIHKQRAKGRLIIDLSPRISRFSRSVRAKRILNIVFRHANKYNGTAFPLFTTAAAARAAAEAKLVSVPVPRVVVDRAECQLPSIMPPKKTSSPNVGTVLQEMNADRLQEDTEAFQLNVQRLLHIQGRGARRGTSAGIPGIPMMPRPRGPVFARGVGESRASTPRGRQAFRGLRGGPGPSLPAPRGQAPARAQDREAERAALRRRLAELDEEADQSRLGRESGQAAQHPGGVETLPRRGNVRRRAEEPRFRREDQEELSDASYKKKIEEAASRMLSSGFGGSMGAGGQPMFGVEMTPPLDISDKESVSSDSSNDDSEEEERKRKARKRNAQKDAKRRKKEEEDLSLGAESLGYRETNYAAAEQGYYPGAGYGSMMERSGPGSAFYQHSGYQDNLDLSHWAERLEGGEYGQGWDEAEVDQAAQSSYQGGNVDSGDFEEDWGGEQLVEAEEEAVLQNVMDDNPPPPEQEPLVKAKKEEKGEPTKTSQPRQKEVVPKRAQEERRSQGKEVAKKPSMPRIPKLGSGSGKKERKGPEFSLPEDLTKKAPKKRIVKVSGDSAPAPSSKGGERGKITKEEMAAAVANIKKESVTPPKPMSNTIRSNELKGFLVSTLPTEMDLEMNVHGSQVCFCFLIISFLILLF